MKKFLLILPIIPLVVFLIFGGSFVYGQSTTTATSSTEDSEEATTTATSSTDSTNATTTNDTDSSQSTEQETEASQPVDNLTIIAFGDSLVEGVGSDGGGFVSDLEDMVDISIHNEGRSGDSTAEALDRLDGDVLAQDPDIVILLLGGNDFLQGVPEEETFANLEEIITQIQATGSRVILLGAHGEFYKFDREDDYRSLANKTDSFYVSRVLRDIIGNPNLLADPVHPNDEGYELIAERTFPVLQNVIFDIPTTGISGTCKPDRAEAVLGNRVTWQAHAVGGNNNTFTYDWSGSDGLNGSGDDQSVIYNSEGEKTARVIVKTGDESDTFICSPNVTVIAPPLSGSCSVEIDVSDQEIEWSASVTGGSEDYEYEWNGTDGLEGTFFRIKKQYDTVGVKTADVTVTSGSQTLNLPCQGELPPVNDTTRGIRLSCDTNTPPFEIGDKVRWNVDIFNVDGRAPVSVEWSGTDGLSSTQQDVTKVYNSVGTKFGNPTITIGENELDFSCSINVVEEGGKSGCFIATAAYGTPMAQDIDVLRNFRDTTMKDSVVGRKLISLYYKTSPPIADFISDHEWLKSATRTALKPIIAAVD